jgi:glycosyltransferase involved in cell wall biosynthesis
MNILIVSNFFYPKIHIASYRIEAYAKYLHLAGHKVSVLTEGCSDYKDTWGGCDIYYVKEKESITNVKFHESDSKIWHMIKSVFNLIYCQVFMDQGRFWKKRALRVAIFILIEHKIDVLITSYGYLAPLLIGLKIKQQYKSIKWIVDMRDEMSALSNFFKITQYRLKVIESKILNCSDLVVSVSKPILEEFKKNCSNKNKFLEITNGYDFKEEKNSFFQNYFTIVYIGSFSGDRKPDNFLRALEELKKNNQIPDDFLFKIVGNLKPLIIPKCLQNNVFQQPKVSYEEAINEMKNSDVLLLVLAKNNRKGFYSGKIFDYLAINRYILALVNVDDVAAQLISQTNSGFSVDTDDIEGIKRYICILHNKWENFVPPQKNWEIIKEHTRKNQVQKLVNYLNLYKNSQHFS